MRYFSYGSNMDVQQMSKRCPESSKVLGTALLNGYEFRINSDGVATIVPNLRQHVWGVVWKISPMDEARLDIYEGVYAGVYRKEFFTVTLTDKTRLRVFAFTATNDLPGKPRIGYLERLLTAGAEHRLPKEYLAKLSSFAEQTPKPARQDNSLQVGECFLLFVYGTLKRGFANHHLLGRAPFIGAAKTKQQYSLYCSSIPYVCKQGKASRITGEIYLVDAEILSRIDDLEGHPQWYYRELVELKIVNGRRISAWMYFYPHPRGHLIPTGEFTQEHQR